MIRHVYPIHEGSPTGPVVAVARSYDEAVRWSVEEIHKIPATESRDLFPRDTPIPVMEPQARPA